MTISFILDVRAAPFALCLFYSASEPGLAPNPQPEDLISFSIQYDLYVRRERLSIEERRRDSYCCESNSNLPIVRPYEPA